MDTTVYYSATSSRQRSSESDASADPVSKRQKSLDTQRAFRARKAAHVKDLEVKVALQDLEVARLKRENEALKQELQALKNATAGSIKCGSTAAQTCNPQPDNGGHTSSVLRTYQANPSRTDALPHLVRRNHLFSPAAFR